MILKTLLVVEGQESVFRKALGSCKCRLLYNGSDDLFVSVQSRGLARQYNFGHRIGYTVNFVSYSLLTDFITYFFRNGVTMRGFYASYESKCIMKYGMKEYELISWRAWHSACNEFMNKIFDINQREAFSYVSCGPRPEALVFDGIAMGLQVQELNKYKEEFCKDQRLESNAHTRLVPYDLWVQSQIHLWIFTHAYWRKSKGAF